MKGRPNYSSKIIQRTKSPLLLTHHPTASFFTKHQEKGGHLKHDGSKLGSPEIKVRVGSPELPKQTKKVQDKPVVIKNQKGVVRETVVRNVKMEGMGKTSKDEDDNTTQQSSSQHLSYVTGEYQLDSYDLFSRRKNVKFNEKPETMDRIQHKRDNSKTSSRNSSILKNSSRVLDHSLASVSQKSISVQNSFTAVRKCKIGIHSQQDNANLIVKRKYDGIVDQLKSSRDRGQGREKYIDQFFPPVEASVFSTSVHRKGHINRSKDEIVWMRLSQIYPKARVFAKGKSGGAVRMWRGEKAYTESYMASSLNAMRGCGELLEWMLQRQEMSAYGVYLVKIYQQNTWKYVIVDDLIPCLRRKKGKHQEAFTPYFLNVASPQSQQMQIWPFLLEKAYASYYSSYQNLCFGNPIDFLSELTGAPYKQRHLVNKKMSKQVLDDNLSSVGTSLSQAGVVAMGWSEDKGLFYPINVLKEIFTGERIQLGLGDPTNNYELIKLELSQLPDLVSMVFIFHFKEYPNTATCPVYPPKLIKQKAKKTGQKQHRVRYLQIPANDTTSLRAFTLFKKTKCCLDIRQKQNRFYWQCGISEYLWVRCMLLQKQYDGGYRWVNGRYSNQKHIIFQENLDAGEYLLVVMVEWRQRHNKELTAVLFSECQYIKFERKNYNRDDRIIELACMDLAQRNGRLSQINKSICAYTYLCQEAALVIENIINQRTKGEVTIMRSVNGLKSKVEILPINREFQVEGHQEYGALEKGEGKKVIGQSVEIDIQKGESFTVVLRMRGGVDRKFFKVFNFG